MVEYKVFMFWGKMLECVFVSVCSDEPHRLLAELHFLPTARKTNAIYCHLFERYHHCFQFPAVSSHEVRLVLCLFHRHRT